MNLDQKSHYFNQCKCELIVLFSGSTTIDDPIQPEVAIAVPVLVLVFLLIVVILLCIFKQRRTRKRVTRVTKPEENPMYGIYSDVYARVEVEDSNTYYSSSDYEAGTGTGRIADNNPDYE